MIYLKPMLHKLLNNSELNCAGGSGASNDSSCDNDICGLGGCGWNVGMGQCEAL